MSERDMAPMEAEPGKPSDFDPFAPAVIEFGGGAPAPVYTPGVVLNVRKGTYTASPEEAAEATKAIEEAKVKLKEIIKDFHDRTPYMERGPYQEERRFCPYCGEERKLKGLYCGECGGKI